MSFLDKISAGRLRIVFATGIKPTIMLNVKQIMIDIPTVNGFKMQKSVKYFIFVMLYKI